MGSDDVQFNQYYQEFNILLKDILEDDNQQQNTARISSCEDLLLQMHIAARNSDNKDDLLQRVNLYTSQLAVVQQKNGAGVVAAPETDDVTACPNRDRLTHMEDSVAKQNDILERARRTMAETEEIAGETINELQNQRESLAATQEKVGALSAMATSANGIMSNMSKPWWLRKAPK